MINSGGEERKREEKENEEVIAGLRVTCRILVTFSSSSLFICLLGLDISTYMTSMKRKILFALSNKLHFVCTLQRYESHI